MNGVKERITGLLWGMALCVVIQWAWEYSHRHDGVSGTACDTVRTVVTDTVRTAAPEDAAGKRTAVGSMVVRAAVDRNRGYRADSCYRSNGGDSCDSIDRGFTGGCTGCGDSVDVRLEMTQRVYRDSMYTAWVSGYMAQLDSIEVYRRTERVSISVRERRGRFGLGAVVGLGYARGGVAPFVGIGVYYRLWEF